MDKRQPRSTDSSHRGKTSTVTNVRGNNIDQRAVYSWQLSDTVDQVYKGVNDFARHSKGFFPNGNLLARTAFSAWRFGLPKVRQACS
jgi:hypothetical protein